MGAVAQPLADIATLGTDRIGGSFGKAISSVIGFSNPVSAALSTGAGAARTVQGLSTPAQTARDSAEVLANEQMADANKMRTQLLQTPKNIAPDNFLADKNRQLANLRLGLASTVTGAGGAPSAVLSSASLASAGYGKSKLGQ